MIIVDLWEVNVMKILFVDASSFVDRLKHLFSGCNKLDVAMAYVKIGGLKPFLDVLNESTLMKENGAIRILFGLSSFHGITDKKSAKLLHKLSQKRRNVRVKKYNNPRFHPKLMIFHGDPNRVVIGSSNLTEGAQSKNAEANVIVEDPDIKFMKDVIDFFETHFYNAPDLERVHVETYTPQPPKTSRGRQGSSKVDELPSHSKPSPPLGRRRHGAGKPVKPKRYYDEKICELESKREPTEQQKLSLRAYRALRTRYYGRRSKEVQRHAILLPVTHGENHLEAIIRARHGNWVIGRKIHEDPSLEGVHIYFYENRIRQTRFKATLRSVHQLKGETYLTIFNARKLKESRKLDGFRKLNGESVRAPLRGFVYVFDPDTE